MAKRAQSAVEFVILVGFMLFFFVSFVYFLQVNIAQKNSQQIDNGIREIALTVQDEVSLAQESVDGYSRTFVLPYGVLSQSYNINITSGFVYIITSNQKHAISLTVLDVTGQPKPGNNTIRKTSGVVYLNQ